MNEERKIETREVDAVAPPPRARVTPEFERKRDYLAGFLAGEQPEEPVVGPGSDLQASVVDALKSIYDPEIPVPIWDLGLIYGWDVEEAPEGGADVTVRMTLTAPNCPAAESLPAEVEAGLNALEGVRTVKLDLVFVPSYSMEMLSDEARLTLGLM